MDQEMDSAAERQKPCPGMSRRLNHLSRGPVWIVSEYAVIHRGSKPSTEITSYKALPSQDSLTTRPDLTLSVPALVL